MLLYLISFTGICLLVLAIILLVYSPGKPGSYPDSKGNQVGSSISEKVFITIGGVRQGMFIRGKDKNNPVILYVHGGPAFPNYFLIDKYAPGLEEYFTVCYWEQRGGGLSYSREVSVESMTFGQLTSDAIDVTNYLRQRFGKDRIYLFAHSGGTPFAIKAVQMAPQLFHAYIGMAQITSQAASEKIAYEYMFREYSKRGDSKALAELKKYPVMESDSFIVPFYKSLARDKSMHELGIGTMRSMKSVFKGVFIPVWMCRAYTIREKINIWKSKFSFLKKTKLIEELFAMDVISEVPELKVPVYFFSGKYDLTVNRELSKEYLNKIAAPVKGFYTFSGSAHSPIYEESERVIEILIKDVLNSESSLADSPDNN